MINILEFGDLISEGEYTVHSRFKNHINFRSKNSLLTITDKTEDSGPLNIIFNSINFSIPQNLVIKNGTLSLDLHNFSLLQAGKYTSELQLSRQQIEVIFSKLQYVRSFILQQGAEKSLKYLLQIDTPANCSKFQEILLEFIRNGFNSLLQGKISEAVSYIKGRGIGLTPSGDDFLTGILYGLHLLEFKGYKFKPIRQRIFADSGTENLISANYLSLAWQGRYFGDLKKLLTVLIADDVKTIDHQLQLFLQKGATSGADMLTGLILTLEHREQLANIK